MHCWPSGHSEGYIEQGSVAAKNVVPEIGVVVSTTTSLVVGTGIVVGKGSGVVVPTTGNIHIESRVALRLFLKKFYK